MRADDLIDEEAAERIEKSGVEQVKIRSVLTCDATPGRLRPLLRP